MESCAHVAGITVEKRTDSSEVGGEERVDDGNEKFGEEEECGPTLLTRGRTCWSRCQQVHLSTLDASHRGASIQEAGA